MECNSVVIWHEVKWCVGPKTGAGAQLCLHPPPQSGSPPLKHFWVWKTALNSLLQWGQRHSLRPTFCREQAFSHGVRNNGTGVQAQIWLNNQLLLQAFGCSATNDYSLQPNQRQAKTLCILFIMSSYTTQNKWMHERTHTHTVARIARSI